MLLKNTVAEFQLTIYDLNALMNEYTSYLLFFVSQSCKAFKESLAFALTTITYFRQRKMLR